MVHTTRSTRVYVRSALSELPIAKVDGMWRASALPLRWRDDLEPFIASDGKPVTITEFVDAIESFSQQVQVGTPEALEALDPSHLRILNPTERQQLQQYIKLLREAREQGF